MTEVSVANAAFIVLAVNSHADLVKALTELRNEVAGNLVDTSKEHLIANADAALAKVQP